LGTEPENKDNWITPNHDIYRTRHSNQTTIEKDNVNQLQIKKIFESIYNTKSSFCRGNKGYALDNCGHILAIDLKTGLNLWKFEIGGNGQNQYGITYDKGVIFTGTGKNATLLAVNATDGIII
jgi:outer membrane protein assembly factor BamB